MLGRLGDQKYKGRGLYKADEVYGGKGWLARRDL